MKKILDYIKYIFTHPRKVLLPVILAEIIFWIPVWVPAILALTISPWWWSIVGAVTAFWAAPLTPAIPLQIGLIALLERLLNKKENKKNDR